MAYQLPGTRGDNRVRDNDLISFLRSNDMPLPPELSPSLNRILIVDDDKNAAKAIQRVLRQEDYETEIAFDGFSAGAMMEKFIPAVVTLDLAMPGMGGIDVIRFIRARKEFAHVRILVVSALEKRELDKALEAGADDVLQKPYKNAVLLTKLKDLVHKP